MSHYPAFDQLQAICFDLDGTLADTDDAAVLRMARRLRLLSKLRFFRSPEILARQIVMGVETPINRLLSLLDALHLDGLLTASLRSIHALRGYRSAQEIELIEGVLPLLEQLQPRYPLALVTARDADSTALIIDRLGLRRFFPIVASAHTCRRTKPHPAPLLWAARQLGVKPEGCLMVGDTTVDILAGRKAGFATIGVLCGFGEERELLESGAHLVLPSTAQLQRVLSGDSSI